MPTWGMTCLALQGLLATLDVLMARRESAMPYSGGFARGKVETEAQATEEAAQLKDS